MKIIDILNQDKITLSFEVFPPKLTKNYDDVAFKAKEIAKLHPDFMSVTYGAGGGTSEYTLNIAKEIKEKENVEVMAHLTCVSSSKEHVHSMIHRLKENHIENIMALRGDIPSGGSKFHDYQHAMPQNSLRRLRQVVIFVLVPPVIRKVILKLVIKIRILRT